MRVLYLIGAVVGFIVIPEVYGRIRRRIGYSTNLSEVEGWIRKHVRGGSHNSRLLLRDRTGNHVVEFHKWAPRIGFGGRLGPSRFFLIIHEGEYCSSDEFRCAQDLIEEEAIRCEIEADSATTGRIMKADIKPDTDLVTELVRRLYRNCFGRDDPALKVSYRGQVRMRPCPEIMGWTDKLSQKKAAHYERKKYEGKTGLHIGASEGTWSADLYRYRINNRKDPVDVRNEHGATPLITAGYFGNYVVAEVLLEEGANIRACDRTHRTALHCAAWKGHTDVVELLLDHDALTGIKDKEGKTPLDLAEENEHHEIAELLKRERTDRETDTARADSEECEEG